MIKIILSLILGYIFGSIPFAIVVSSMKGINIMNVGTKNPGAANVYREVGKFYGILVWLLDTIKAVIPMLFSKFLLNLHPYFIGLSGIAALSGHCWSLFLKFKGGKGVSTAGGILLFLFPKFFPFSLILYFITRKAPRNIYLVLSIFFLGILIAFMFYKESLKWVIPFFIIFLSVGALANIETIKELKR
jgi:glycerol-3-phosphate acyltransferase PlsY